MADRPLYCLCNPDFPLLSLQVFFFPSVCTVVDGFDCYGAPYRAQFSGAIPPIDILNMYRSIGCERAEGGGQ